MAAASPTAARAAPAGGAAGRALPPAAPWLLALLALGGLLGTAFQLQQPELATLPTRQAQAAAGAALALLSALLSTRWLRLGRGRWARRVGAAAAAATAAALLACAATDQRAAGRLAERLPPALEGVDLELDGVVDELPRAGPDGTRFTFAVEAARWHGGAADGRPAAAPPLVSLGWWNEGDDDPLLSGPPPSLRAGQRWRLPVRLQQPHAAVNPHGFDAELWLFERGIGATGSVRARPQAPALLLAPGAGRPVERLRQHVRDAIVLHVANPATAGVLAALAIGDQAAIDREGWDLFRATGVAHLMSISGLHVTMFAWLAGAVVGRLWRLSPRAMRALPAPQAARWCGLAAAAGYALLAGWGVPAQRTVAMIAIVVALRSAGLRWPLHAVLLAAACAVAAIDPWALLQPGFWLSFVAVALLVASEPVHDAAAASLLPPAGWRSRLTATVRGGLRSQAVATAGLAPLTLVFFQQLSLVGFAANLVAIPLVTLAITPLALLGVALPPLWLLSAGLVKALDAYLQALASLPLAQWTAGAAPPWAMACGLLAGLLAVLPLPLRLRWLALPLMLPLLAPPQPRPAPGRFELVAVDIGQGTAVLVRTAHHLLVFDTGPAWNRGNDAGARLLLPLLRARGERRADRLVLSHRDADHVGGAASLIAGLPVARITSSLGEDHPLLARPGAPPHDRCDAGQRWAWDGVRFDVLHPLASDHATATKSNALSCVVRVEGENGVSALLTGDVEAAQEAAIVARAGGGDAAVPLRSDVLLVPHHGSRTSSTPAFVDAVAPRVAVVQAGYRSRYGHPAPDVVARYEARGIAVVRSDSCGAWMLDASGDAHCERDRARRYWHHRAADLP